jgi:hypothetical protein
MFPCAKGTSCFTDFLGPQSTMAPIRFGTSPFSLPGERRAWRERGGGPRRCRQPGREARRFSGSSTRRNARGMRQAQLVPRSDRPPTTVPTRPGGVGPLALWHSAQEAVVFLGVPPRTARWHSGTLDGMIHRLTPIARTGRPELGARSSLCRDAADEEQTPYFRAPIVLFGQVTLWPDYSRARPV